MDGINNEQPVDSLLLLMNNNVLNLNRQRIKKAAGKTLKN